MKKLISRITKSKLAKTSLVNGAANFIKILSSLVSSKITAVYLGPAGVALLGQFMNVSTMAMIFSTLGINAGITKFTAEYHDDLKKRSEILGTGFVMILCGSAFISLAVFLGRGYLSRKFLHTDQYSSVFGVLGFTIVLFALNIFFISVLNGYKEFKKIASVNMVGSVLGLVIAILLVIRYGVLGAFLGFILSQSLVLFATLFFVINSAWFSTATLFSGVKMDSVKKLFRFSLMTLTSIFAVTFVQLQIRDFIIRHISIESAGYWQGITRISDLYLTFITTTLSMYYLPRLSELNKKEDIKREVLKGFAFILPLAMASALTIFLLRGLIVKTLLAKTFLPMLPLFQMQLIGDVLKISSWLLAYLLIAKAMTKIFIITEIAFGASLYVLTRIFVIKMGVVGATYAFALNYFIYFFVMLFIFKDIFLTHKVKTGVSPEVIYGKTDTSFGGDTNV